MQTAQSLRIQEASQVGEARRAAASLAEKIGFDDSETGRVALIATELGTNLVKHTRGKGGELLIRCDSKSLEILSLDQGPGMENVAESMRDGHSTAGSRGEGLGGIRRLSSRFDLFSRPGQGTVIFSLVCPDRADEGTGPPFEIGGVCLPLAGETLSGDAWSYAFQGDEATLLLADGLGHGLLAHEAAREAVEVFEASSGSGGDLNVFFQKAHGALRKTRGAAVSVARVDLASASAEFLGIGNVSGSIVSVGRSTHLVSLSGIVGHEMRKTQAFSYSFEGSSALVLHSDGLLSRWDLASYPGLLNRHPSVIAGVLYRDFNRGRDDVAVIVLKRRAA